MPRLASLMNFSHEVAAGQTRYAETTVTPPSGQISRKAVSGERR
jgi:hypothetical protein